VDIPSSAPLPCPVKQNKKRLDYPSTNVTPPRKQGKAAGRFQYSELELTAPPLLCCNRLSATAARTAPTALRCRSSILLPVCNPPRVVTSERPRTTTRRNDDKMFLFFLLRSHGSPTKAHPYIVQYLFTEHLLNSCRGSQKYAPCLTPCKHRRLHILLYMVEPRTLASTLPDNFLPFTQEVVLA
jgi:hypothetical protein